MRPLEVSGGSFLIFVSLPCMKVQSHQFCFAMLLLCSDEHSHSQLTLSPSVFEDKSTQTCGFHFSISKNAINKVTMENHIPTLFSCKFSLPFSQRELMNAGLWSVTACIDTTISIAKPSRKMISQHFKTLHHCLVEELCNLSSQ